MSLSLSPQNIRCIAVGTLNYCCFYHEGDEGERANEINLSRFLCEACILSHFNCVKMLVKAGANVNEKDKYGRLPIVQSVYRGNVECMKFLLDNGAKINEFESNHNYGYYYSTGNALHNAIVYKRYDIVSFLLEKGADISAPDTKGNTPLHRIFLGNSHFNETAKLLIDNGADVNARNSKGETPLHIAVSQHQSKKAIKLLLESGADVNAKDSKGNTPLHKAAKYRAHVYGTTSAKAIECIQILLNSGAHLNDKNNKGKTPRYLAGNNAFCDEGIYNFLRDFQDLPE